MKIPSNFFKKTWKITPGASQNELRESIRLSNRFFSDFWRILEDFGTPRGDRNFQNLDFCQGWSALLTIPLGIFSDFFPSLCLECCREAFWTQKGSQNHPKSMKIKQKSMENQTQNSPTNACKMVAPRAKNQAQIPAKICKILQKTCAPSQIPIRSAILLRVRRSRASVFNNKK